MLRAGGRDPFGDGDGSREEGRKTGVKGWKELAQPFGASAPMSTSEASRCGHERVLSGIHSSPYTLGAQREKEGAMAGRFRLPLARVHTRAHRGSGWLSAGECERGRVWARVCARRGEPLPSPRTLLRASWEPGNVNRLKVWHVAKMVSAKKVPAIATSSRVSFALLHFLCLAAWWVPWGPEAQGWRGGQLRAPAGRRPSQGRADPRVSTVRSGAAAGLFCAQVDAESRRGTGCKKSAGFGVRVHWVRLSWPFLCPPSFRSASFSLGQETLSLEDKPVSTCSVIDS